MSLDTVAKRISDLLVDLEDDSRRIIFPATEKGMSRCLQVSSSAKSSRVPGSCLPSVASAATILSSNETSNARPAIARLQEALGKLRSSSEFVCDRLCQETTDGGLLGVDQFVEDANLLVDEERGRRKAEALVQAESLAAAAGGEGVFGAGDIVAKIILGDNGGGHFASI